MRGFLLLLLLAAACLFPAWASDPGEPLDCEDWVFLEPGFTCTSWRSGSQVLLTVPPINNSAFDNSGAQYRYEQVSLGSSECGELERIRLLRYDSGGSESVFAYIDERCNGPNRTDNIENPEGFYIEFDDTAGRMFVWLKSRCVKHTSGPDCAYTSDWWIASIDGFASTFEILQSYEPATNTIGYRVPYMPEGFAGASYFDTYYGPLTNPIEFGKAQPLRCGYPASPPSAGDYLTVADPLPDPPVNTGRYYITAVNHMGQRRYGRQNSGGVLSGRNPGVLPWCDGSRTTSHLSGMPAGPKRGE